MADKEAIKRTILDIAGNPSVGRVKELADEWATAIAALDEEPVRATQPVKQTRVVKAEETR